MAKRTGKGGRPTSTTRDRMVAGAADLLRRRGVAATSLREVVRHTRTPRGSLAHHFPSGKAQLLEEALAYSRRHVSGPLEQALERLGPIRGLQAFALQWRRTLEATGFGAGCPVMAVAIEHAADEPDDATPCQRRLLDLAQAAFDEWAGLMAAALRREGVPAPRAHSLAVLVIASFEGAIGMARAARSCEPLEEVAREIEAVVAGALPTRRRSTRREPAR